MNRKDLQEEEVAVKKIRRRTIMAFVVFFVLIGFAIAGWKWLNRQDTSDGALKPLRAILNENEK